MPITISCLNCKKDFLIKPYQAETRKWCSNECKNQAHRIKKTCGHCNVEFWIFASQERKGLGQFCSKPCRDLNRTHPKKPKVVREKIYRVCVHCGITFKVTPSRAETAKFCSRKCHSINPEAIIKRKSKNLGESSARWTGGKYLRSQGYISQKTTGSKVFRYEHQNVMLEWILQKEPNHPFLIEVNGVKKFSPNVVIHHIDRDRANNSRTNLLAVVKVAHAAIHNHGKRPEPWECWPSNPVNW